MKKLFPCPCCGRPVVIDGPQATRFRPFCSDRCRLIDLGQWAEGAYVVPAHRAVGTSDAAMDEYP